MHSGLNALLNRREPSAFQLFWLSPVRFLAKKIYSLLEPAFPVKKDGIRVVCISDTHNTRPALPDGDVLLHAGDLTQSGSLEELGSQIEWLDLQPHKFKVVIAGNHDLCLDKTRPQAHVVHDATFPGGRPLKIYGSPWTPKHGNWQFQYFGRDPWKGKIPDDTDILLTHGPAKHHLDLGHLGCPSLLQELKAKPPLLDVFGHIHAGHGKSKVIWDSFEAAYEGAVGKEGSCFDLAKMVMGAMPRLMQRWQGGSRGTVLVNASAIGGFRDEQQRQIITVII